MAIAAGRRLADRLFAGVNGKADYDDVPTVVFSHPPIGTVGLEKQAVEKYGESNVKVWTSTFVNLWYGPMPIDPSDKPRTAMKMVTAGKNELIVGLHVIGVGADFAAPRVCGGGQDGRHQSGLRLVFVARARALTHPRPRDVSRADRAVGRGLRRDKKGGGEAMPVPQNRGRSSC